MSTTLKELLTTPCGKIVGELIDMTLSDLRQAESSLRTVENMIHIEIAVKAKEEDIAG